MLKARVANIAELEFNQLVREVASLHYTRTSQVSNYIQNNQLGRKYSHIAGRLEMQKNGDTWYFDGGIAPEYYRRLCNALHLYTNGSSARVRSFRSYSQL